MSILMPPYRTCIDMGFIGDSLGWHEWTSKGLYRVLNSKYATVVCLDYTVSNLVVIF